MSYEPEDKALSFLQSFRRGEESAFDQLFREYSGALTYFAFRLINHQKEAEDIVQECFISLWQRRKRLDHIESIKNYLYTSVRNQCNKALKQKGKKTIPAQQYEGRNIEELVIAAETARELHRLIGQLPPGMQQVINLYYLEEKTYQEIGTILNIDPESVRMQRYRALLALRKTIIPLW